VKFGDCYFAPSAATPRDAIRVGQRVVDRGTTVYEAFAPLAFRDAGVRASDVPVLLDHDVTKRAGTVTALITRGDWHVAGFALDGPFAAEAAEWIARSGKVSPGFTELDKDPIMATPITAMHIATHWYSRARLDEISVVPPGAIAWYQGARVTSLREHTPKPRPAPAAAGTNAGGLVRRARPRTRDPYSAIPVGEVFEHLDWNTVRLERTGAIIRLRSRTG
jgi:hypothetical protein